MPATIKWYHVLLNPTCAWHFYYSIAFLPSPGCTHIDLTGSTRALCTKELAHIHLLMGLAPHVPTKYMCARFQLFITLYESSPIKIIDQMTCSCKRALWFPIFINACANITNNWVMRTYIDTHMLATINASTSLYYLKTFRSHLNEKGQQEP